MKVVDYDYIQEISTADALKAAASDVSSWYNWEIPWVNTFKINAETSIYNEQWGWEWLGIAWWSTDVKWTPHNWSISWSSWSISLPDWTSISISSWSQSISSSTYLYVDTTDWTVYEISSNQPRGSRTVVWRWPRGLYRRRGRTDDWKGKRNSPIRTVRGKERAETKREKNRPRESRNYWLPLYRNVKQWTYWV